ncbi:recombinase family protein [Microbacterium sp. NEAU-LLB]|uniref:Recombinase family protein n=1 Tax=Microbacterium stercoris TaxID=2820289 RepID=A0A939TR24_9MICO|nr:recombinase family protein [Microbacterium stercoris]MBO3664065.1 recombinase family protein [Microbacterium stercoris]
MRSGRAPSSTGLANLSTGDVVVVAELDRLRRDAGHVITTIPDLRERGIHVRALADGVDSTTDMGEPMMRFLAIMGQMERRFFQRREFGSGLGLGAREVQRPAGPVGCSPPDPPLAVAEGRDQTVAVGTLGYECLLL